MNLTNQLVPLHCRIVSYQGYTMTVGEAMDRHKLLGRKSIDFTIWLRIYYPQHLEE